MGPGDNGPIPRCVSMVTDELFMEAKHMSDQGIQQNSMVHPRATCLVAVWIVTAYAQGCIHDCVVLWDPAR